MTFTPQGAFGAFGAFGTQGAFGAFGAFGSEGAFGAPGGESPLIASAYMTNRDGITGAALPPVGEMTAGVPDDPRNLQRLAPWVRFALYQSELAPSADVTFHLQRQEHHHHPTVTAWRRNPGSGAGEAGGQQPQGDQLVQLTAPGIDCFKEQLSLVSSYARIRPDRASEILTQAPAPMPFFATIGFMDQARTPYTLELLSAALGFGATLYQRMKYGLAIKRPIEFSPQVQPMIPTPTHGALPSGHATEAFIMARLIWKLMRESGAPQYTETAHWGEMLMRLASRVAINRTVAGVHFPADSAAGAMLGLVIADHVQSMCTGADWTSASFEGPHFGGYTDFDWHQLYIPDDDSMQETFESEHGTWGKAQVHDGSDCTPSAILHWLWSKARAEWQDFPKHEAR